MATLFGRYEYAGELGSGASGRVFAVRDLAGDAARRAIKVVPREDAPRLVWEFARLCQVEHPRIARVRELLRVEQPVGAPFGLAGGALVLVEDVVDGMQLSSALAQTLELTARLELAARASVGIAEALCALHEVSLVHGDVKPDNVLCDARGDGATLIDLGFARPPALASVPHGTPAYMAPELFAGVCTPAADVYALGAVLYDCLTGDAAQIGSSRHGHLPWRKFDLTILPLAKHPLILRLLARLLEPDHRQRPADAAAALALMLPAFANLGLALAPSPVRYAGLALVRSAEERAARTQTLPFVGHERALAELVMLLGSAPLVRVRGARGAGRSRLIREAIRVLQEQRARAGAVVPTWVSTVSSLELLRDVDAILWLDDTHPLDLATVERAAAVAKLALRSVCVVLECGLGEHDEGAPAHTVTLEPLASGEFAALLERLLAPDRITPALLAEARASSQGFSGRLCQLVCSLSLAERDLTDPRAWRDAPRDGASDVLSPAAAEVARVLAWWGGGAVTPAHAQRLLAATTARDRDSARAYEELRVKGLLTEADGTLALIPTLATRLRTDLAAVRGVFAERVAAAGVRASSGFAYVATNALRDAEAAFLGEARSLRDEGRSDAAAALLAEARQWVDSAQLRGALADAERAAGHYVAALATLSGPANAHDPSALLLSVELARMNDQPALAHALLEQLATRSEPQVLARAKAQRARLSFDAGDMPRARAEAHLAIASDDREAQLRGLEVEVLVCMLTGELQRAPVDELVDGALAAPAVPVAQGASFLVRAPARAHALRAQVLLRRGERARALSDLRAAVDHARAHGEAHETATYALNLGLAELESGELGRALETLREAAQRLARVARTRDLARVLFNFAALALLIGDFDRCEVVLAEASRALGSAPDHLVRAFVALVRAELYVLRGSLEAAERELEEALERLPEALCAARAVLAARACQVAVARHGLDRAASYLSLAEKNGDALDLDSALELLTAELSLALARGELAAAERVALRGLAKLTEQSAFAERLRFLLATVESARASGNALGLAERTALARALLERALVTLPSELRAKMRAVPAYARVFASGDYARDNDEERRTPQAPERWRALVRASRRLFSETRESRIAQRLTEIALELVHAERALVVSFDEKSALSVFARSELSGEAERNLGFSRSVIERVAIDGQPLMTVEAGADVRLDRAESVAALQVRSVLCLELFGLRTRAFLYLDDRLRPSAFVADDLALLQDLVELARQALRAWETLQREGRRARRAEQQQKRLTRELSRSSALREQETTARPLIGVSGVLERVVSSARKVALSDAPVLIHGESGTGKELLARYVHEVSPRKTRAFVAESCAAIPDTLLESALFGHVRGAFTGADRTHKGLFEAADGGTLLLDEVGEMSPSLQGKLLRVLQEGELRPLGSERTKTVDVRVIGATRRDLLALVQAGRFREDLYYRLAVVTLELPPLRERPEDIPLLVAHFLAKHAAGRAVRIEPRALLALEQRSWPGNVRELENEVRRALAFSDGEIDLAHLSSVEPSADDDQADALDLHGRTDDLTRRLVREALARAGGNVTHAATLLGISRFGLQKILKRLQLSAK